MWPIGENNLADFEIEGQLPAPLRYTLIVVDRLGFPIFAFCMMSFMCFRTLEKVVVAINRNTEAITALAHRLHIKLPLEPSEDD